MRLPVFKKGGERPPPHLSQVQQLQNKSLEDVQLCVSLVEDPNTNLLSYSLFKKPF